MAVVIPTWNRVDLIERCLRALAAQRRMPDQVVVVDNGSQDGTADRVSRDFPAATLVRLPDNHGFAGGVNRGIEAVTPGFDVVLLNNDAVPDQDWLERLVVAAQEAGPRVGVLASKILDSEGITIDSVGDFLNRAGVPVPRGRGERDCGQYDDTREVTSACAGASYYRRELLRQLDGFDEDFFAYYEDVDICLRARSRGWTVAYVHDAVVRHDIGATSSSVAEFARYHTLRNLWFLVLKDVPVSLLVTMLPAVVLVQVRRTVLAVMAGEGRTAWLAHRDAARALPATMRKRRAVQRGSQLSGRSLRADLVNTYRASNGEWRPYAW